MFIRDWQNEVIFIRARPEFCRISHATSLHCEDLLLQKSERVWKSAQGCSWASEGSRLPDRLPERTSLVCKWPVVMELGLPYLQVADPSLWSEERN